MSPKPVSVVLLCRDRWADTLRCLRSLKRHTDPRLYDLLVYDNASRDATPAGLRLLARGWPELRVVTNRRNVPFAAAVNRGVRQTRGRHVLWLNNDTVVGPGWLEGLLKAVAPQDVAAAGPMTDHMAPPRQLGAARPGAGTASTPILGGFCLLVKRAAVEDVGPLDERFLWGWEDVDYCLRLRQAGWRLVLARGVFVSHVGNRTIDAMPAAGRRRTDLANRVLIQEKWPTGGALGDDVRDLIRRSPAPWHPPGTAASVIVACRGGAAAVRACLESLRRGAPRTPFEVLAVDMADDGRTGALLHRLAARRAGLRVLGPWGPVGAPEALNRAAALARGEFLLFLDDGVRAEPGWLSALLAAAAARTEPAVVEEEEELAAGQGGGSVERLRRAHRAP
ncbi:glycosyltransferase, partial [bacterium]